MKTSVVMATYNGAKYLHEQLESLRRQTKTIDEVIICDDRSSDDTVKLLTEYICENDLSQRWQVIVNEQNMGYANNFHKAMQMAKGEYIFFSDQDDIWHFNKVEEVVAVMEENPQIQLLCTDYEPFTSAENAPEVPDNILKKMTGDGSINEVPLNKKNIHISSLGCVMCIRKSFRDQITPYWIKGWAHDDFVWKTAQCVDGCYEYHKPLIKRRLHSSNVSMKKMHTRHVRAKFLKELAEANSGMLNFAKSVNMDKKKIHFIERTVRAAVLRRELVEKRKLSNCIRLLGYTDCYHSRKSILMEPYIAIRK